LEGKRYESVPEAVKSALAAASESDIIYVGGSNFTVADAL